MVRIGGRALAVLASAAVLLGSGCTRRREEPAPRLDDGRAAPPRVHVAFLQDVDLPGHARALYTSKAPGAETFMAPVPLTEVVDVTSLSMAVGTDDAVHVAYQLLDGGTASVVYRRGSWAGGTLRLSPPVTIGVDRRNQADAFDHGLGAVRLVLDPAGNPQIGFMVGQGEGSSCQLARSADGGTTFLPPVTVAAPCWRFELAAGRGATSMVVDGCPPGKQDGCGLLYRDTAGAALVPLVVPSHDPTYGLGLSRADPEIGILLTTGRLPRPCGSRLGPPCVADELRTQVWHSSDGGRSFATVLGAPHPGTRLERVDAHGGLHLLDARRHHLRSRLAHTYVPFGASSAEPRFVDDGCRPPLLSGARADTLVADREGTVHAGLRIGLDAIGYALVNGEDVRCEEAARGDGPANLDMAIDARRQPHLVWRTFDPDDHVRQNRLLYTTRDPRTGRFGAPVRVNVGPHTEAVREAIVRVTAVP